MTCGRIRQTMAMVFCCLVMLAGPGLATGQHASPQVGELPELSAPFGLGGVTLPENEAELWELFAALPTVVNGEDAQPMADLEDRIIASWGAPEGPSGSPLTLQVLSFPEGDFFPADFTAEAFVTMSIGTEDSEATAAGREGDLVWLQTETTVGFAGDKPGTPEASMILYTMSWGLADGQWLFSATATTPEGLEAVVMAFVETATAAT